MFIYSYTIVYIHSWESSDTGVFHTIHHTLQPFAHVIMSLCNNDGSTEGSNTSCWNIFFHYPCCSAWFTTQLQMVKTCFSTSEQLSAGFSLPHLIQVNISSTGALPWVARGNVRTQSRRRELKIASELVEWFL